jgi:4-alpha-glucanotransferase
MIKLRSLNLQGEKSKVNFPRSSGILLHPTSLPGRFGIGDLGHTAYRFVDFLAASGQRLWQILPLGPTGYGDSPYQCFSAFAGNHLLISPEKLAEEGLLTSSDLESVPPFPEHEVDYGPIIEFKLSLLKKSFASFTPQADFAAFCEQNGRWLAEYALFMSLKEVHGGVAWGDWEQDVAVRQPATVARWREELADSILFHEYLQYQFSRQWSALKRYANERGINIVGDIPIFVAHDSADVWMSQELFYLDEKGRPTVVAGVPPDYFSATGQLWGNPLYRWEAMAQTGYAWWVERFRATLGTVDLIRLDHFRGFEAYWEVPASESTATIGRWVKGPGADLFNAVERALGHLPIIAEDRGVITPEVEALRDRFDFPGMKILQFAFGGGADHLDLPHNFTRNCVAYTGTHDNDTTVGWFTGSSTPAEREFASKYIGGDGRQIHWDFVRLALSSVADVAVIPLQDLMGLDSEARMNYPSRAEGNWRWRYTPDMLTPEIGQRLGEMTKIYGR